MRGWAFGFVCGALVFGALPLIAEDVLRIKPAGREGDVVERVQRLERAVEQLQGKVYGGGASSAVAPSGAGVSVGVTCALETPFDGVFTANAPSELAARAQTLEKCREHRKSNIYCVRSGVKCSP